uniref:CFA20 domain-containing protein n=1 Tax=Graphocephala atropunctata TaxID=36148 RepID=A0A1B6MEA5_9HEMI
MFRDSYQKKLLTILYSGGSKPLEIWDIQVRNGGTRRVKDEDMGTIVFEIAGTNVATAYIVSPPDPRGSLGITLPFITMFIKNLKRYFTFEIQIMDDKNMRRRFRFSNYQSATKVRPFTCSVPLALKPGWNQMQLNLANFTTRAYGTNYMETQRVQIHANCRVRRIYFSDRLYGEEELPRDYRVYMNLRQTQQKQAAPAVATQPMSEVAGQPLLKRLSQTEPAVSKELETLSTGEEKLRKVPSVGVKDRPSKVDFITIQEEIPETDQTMKRSGTLEFPEKKGSHPLIDDSGVVTEPVPVEEMQKTDSSDLQDKSVVERRASKLSHKSETLTPLSEEDEVLITVGPDAEIMVEIPQLPDEMLTDFPSMPEEMSEMGEDFAAMDEGMSEGESTTWGEESHTVEVIQRTDSLEHQEALESHRVIDDSGPGEATETLEVVHTTDSPEE